MRIPVVTGAPAVAGPGDVVQPAPAAGATRHLAGCTCCAGRPALAEALGRLFIARARGEIAFFSRVVVVCGPEQDAAVAAALLADPVTAARFRFAGRLAPQTGSVSSPSPSARCI